MKSVDLRGKVVLVTGASSGIGKALSEAFARNGCRVGLMARRKLELEDLADTIKSNSAEAIALPTDVVDPDQVKAAVDTVLNTWGRIDIAVANAGVGRLHRIVNLNSDKVRQIMDLNFYGAWYLFEAVLPGMLSQGSGHLVGISSLAALRAMPKSGPYSASKAALTMLMEAARVELRSKGINCTVIHPGFVSTPLANQNTFKMPFIIEAEEAADQIIKCINKRKSEAVVPRKLSPFAQLMRIIPNRLFDRITPGY